MKEERCYIKENGRSCRNPVALYYYDKGICQAHFDKYCDGFFNLKARLGIEEKPLVINNNKTIHAFV